jgi:hypothetical protein
LLQIITATEVSSRRKRHQHYRKSKATNVIQRTATAQQGGVQLQLSPNARLDISAEQQTPLNKEDIQNSKQRF